jgi:hypothetical protein
MSQLKRYLSRQDKIDFLSLAAFKVTMDDLAQSWEKLKRPKDLIKYTKMARAFSDKAMKIILENLDVQEQAKIIVESTKIQVVVKYKTEVAKERSELEKLDSITPMVTDDMLDLADRAIVGWCKTCKLTGNEADKCYLRNIMLKHNVAPLDLEAQPGKCPYQY